MFVKEKEKNMNLIFRKIDENSSKDIEQFNELMADLLAPAEDIKLLKKNIRKANTYENYYLMGVEDADHHRLCGTMLAVVIDDFCGNCAPIMLVENVVIHHDYQHQGVGRRMFQEMERWGRKKGVNYALLCSDMEREGAHEFYRAIGCKEVKGFKRYL